MSNPLDRVELLHGIAGVTEATGAFFRGLRGEGFTTEQAMALTIAWLTAASSQAQSEGEA